MLFLMLILGFACKVKEYRASNNGLAVSWKHLAAIGVFVKMHLCGYTVDIQLFRTMFLAASSVCKPLARHPIA